MSLVLSPPFPLLLLYCWSSLSLPTAGEITKPYLTDAPYLVVVSEITYGLDENGTAASAASVAAAVTPLSLTLTLT